jgi:hypothetical protein
MRERYNQGRISDLKLVRKNALCAAEYPEIFRKYRKRLYSVRENSSQYGEI